MGAGEAARLPALPHKRTWIPLRRLCQRVQENLNRGRRGGWREGERMGVKSGLGIHRGRRKVDRKPSRQRERLGIVLLRDPGR